MFEMEWELTECLQCIYNINQEYKKQSNSTTSLHCYTSNTSILRTWKNSLLNKAGLLNT